MSAGEGIDDVVDVEVDEAFLHCAKAILRSELWSPPSTTLADDATWRDLLAVSPFLTLGTVDGGGHADVSPKGDPTDRELRHEPGLERARPWDAGRHVDSTTLPKASCIWTDHVKLNDEPGLVARVARKAVSPGLMEKGLARDYENNLY